MDGKMHEIKTGQPQKRAGKNRKGSTKQRGFGPGIKVQLVVGFILPIVFLIAIGSLSYEKAKSSLIQNFEDSTLGSISMGAKYLDSGFQTVLSDTLQLTLDSSLADYAYGKYVKDPAQGNTAYTKIQSALTVKQASNAFTDAIWIVPKDSSRLMSSESVSGNGFYGEWAESDEGKQALSGKTNFCWMGQHPFLDKKLNLSQNDYAMSYVGILANKAACVVVDISKEAVLNSLKSLNLGEGSLAAFVAPDGRQTSLYNPGEQQDEKETIESLEISEEAFYKENMDKEDVSGSAYITWKEEEYLFIYSKSQINGSALCALVPRASVIGGALQIRQMTYLLVIIACITVGILALAISINISRGIGRIIKRLKLVSDGDLTVRLSTKGHSELSRVSQNIMSVIENTRELIQKVEITLSTVRSSTQRVSTVSDEIWENSEQISGAVKDIDAGVSDQSENVQDCASMMVRLSDRIRQINDNIMEIGTYADSTQKMIGEGIGTIGELSGQSKSATRITEDVRKNVEELAGESEKISGFVDMINSISRQTNMLSLNASIEAARAGQAGRGFSVVADEIQKLAEESLHAANEIANVVKEIQLRMHDTVNAADEAKAVVEKQTHTVVRTKEAFSDMERYTGRLLDKLTAVSESVRQADEERMVTMNAIDNISAVSVQTAAASSTVNQTVDGQVGIAGTLRDAAAELELNMQELTNKLDAFKI